jgi:signal transduction histidine kinase
MRASEDLAHTLQSIARASRDLLSAEDFERGLSDWLALVRQSTDADCCGFYQRTTLPEGGRDTFKFSAEAWRAGVGQPIGVSFAEPHVIDPAGVESIIDAMLNGQAFVFQTADLPRDSPGRLLLEKQGTATIITAPIVIDGFVWGAVGFDFVERTEVSARYIGVLQTAADTLAAIIQRNQAQEAALAEREARISAERLRVERISHVVELLQQVVGGARRLIECEPADFERALRAWLGEFGEQTKATRATIYDTAPFESTGQETFRALCEWVRDGVEGSTPVSFDRPHIVDPRGAEELVRRSLRGELVAYHTAELEGPLQQWMADQGNATVVVVPIFKNGALWGSVSFDYAERTEPRDEEVAVLRAAADSLASVLVRNELQAQVLDEQRAYAAKLERTNQLLASSMLALADSATPDDVVLQILKEMVRPCGSDAAGVFRIDWETRRITDGIVLDRGQVLSGTNGLVFADDPMESVPELDRLLACTRPTIVTLPEDGGMLLPRSLPFHLERGYKALVILMLQVAGRPQWFLGLAGRDASKLTRENLETFELISHQLKLALELKRLGEQARQFALQRAKESANKQRERALLEERNRIARDVHDTLAQGFTGVSMQLEAARAALGKRKVDQAEGHLLQANDLARRSLAEARESVYALRPSHLAENGVVNALQALVAHVDAAGVIGAQFELRGMVRPLPDGVETALLRVAQESLANVVKHARADAVRLSLVYAEDAVSLAVRDDGIGFDTESPRSGLGITGMYERASGLRGRLLVASAVGAGTEIVFSVQT